MNRQQKAFNKRWITALRSGDYNQARGVAKDRFGAFCALGVGYSLCRGAKFVPMGVDFMPEDGQIFPTLLKERSGLSEEALIQIFGMNDSKYAPFTEIADYLEKQL